MNNKEFKKNKILVILGPTSTGKSDLAVDLARDLNGEVISADSRQVYKGMDVGTGKVTKRETKGVPHCMLNIASPKRVFTVAHYQKLAGRCIEEILKRGKLPIICGGTGLYIRAVVDGLVLPEVPPNPALRERLAKMSPSALYEELKRLDPRRAAEIDRANPRRLTRAIEIARAMGRVPELITRGDGRYDFLQIGLKLDEGRLKERIHKRLIKRMKQGMVAEVKRLRDSGVSWRRLESFGLEYRFVSRYLRGLSQKNEMIDQLEVAIRQYAKRQMTWFKRDKRVKWFDPADLESIRREVLTWLDVDVSLHA